MVSRLVKLSALVLLASVLQGAASAQEESSPQTRRSSKGLAYVDLSTFPANPVSGQSTIIMLEFLDPLNKAPRADIYYKMVIRNETGTVFVLPGGSTISGKVGIPYQFDNPGNYQVEIDLNNTDVSKVSSGSLDRVTFPLYVAQGSSQGGDQAVLNSTVQQPLPPVNIEPSSTNDGHLWIDGALIAVAAGIGAYIVRRRTRSKGAMRFSR